MVVNSALLLLLRSISTSLLILVDWKIFLSYTVGDQLLYLGVKLVNRDFLYWLPIEGKRGLALSFVFRAGVKTLTDFTGVIQLRAPGEMGGAAWIWTMCVALVTPWVAVPVYFSKLTSGSTDATDIEISSDSTTDVENTVDQSDVWELDRVKMWGLLIVFTAGWVRARHTREQRAKRAASSERSEQRAKRAASEASSERSEHK